jgi:methylenetetrahydrofolate--tRNA-(uracil-5-)-methyltransferase
VLGLAAEPPPATTALGALLNHITSGHVISNDVERGAPRSFQPMNINYGLLPDLALQPTHDKNGARLKGPERGREKKRAMSRRALADLDRWLGRGASHAVKLSA